MSSTGDENAGPEVPIKGTANLDGPHASALKHSNKANIMSPPVSPRKKLDRGDGLMSQNSMLMKENLDQTVTVDSTPADDDDIISFKPPESMEFEHDTDPFKSRTQLANSPIINSRQTMNDSAPSACSTQHEQHENSKESETPSCSGTSEETPKNDVSAFPALNSLKVNDPSKPLSQLMNSPVKDCIRHADEDASKKQDSFPTPVEKIESSDSNDKTEISVVQDESDRPISKLQETKVLEEVPVGTDPSKPFSKLVSSPAELDTEDPFKPRTQIANSPTASKCFDSLKPDSQLPSSQGKTDDVLHVLEIKNQQANSQEDSTDEAEKMQSPPSALHLEGPSEAIADMTTKTPVQPQTSGSSVENVQTDKLTAETSESKLTSCEKNSTQIPCDSELSAQVGQPCSLSGSSSVDMSDPFKPQQQLLNTPEKSSSDGSIDLDPFKPRLQLANSPGVEREKEEIHLLKTSTLLPKSPERPVISDSLLTTEKQDSAITASQFDADSVKPEHHEQENISSEKNEDTSKQKQHLSYSSDKKEGVSSEMDAFKPNPQLLNSPPKADTVADENVDPFKPRAQLVNSPLKPGVDDGDPFKSKIQLANSPAKGEAIGAETDPFKPQTQLANSPSRREDICTETDHFKPQTHLYDSLSKMDDVHTKIDPFKSETQLANSPPLASVSENTDPFKPETQLANSPAKSGQISAEADIFKAKTQVVNLPSKIDIFAEVNPFEPKVKQTSLLTKTSDTDADTFKSKTQLADSPAKTDISAAAAENNPPQSITQLTNSPSKVAADTEADLFKPKAQLANSPAKADDISVKVNPVQPKTLPTDLPSTANDTDADPFKPKTQLANSPSNAVDTSADPFKPETQLANLPSNAVDTSADPFKPKTQLANSPSNGVDISADPFKPKTQLANSPSNAVDTSADPFKPKTQLANSPSNGVDISADPFKPETQLANLPSNAVDRSADPFKHKTQLANLPSNAVDTSADPFKPKTQLANSPSKRDNTDADHFKPKTQLANSPSKRNDTDAGPFKPKTQLANSPPKTNETDTDPFKPKTQLANLPSNTCNTDADPFKPKTQLANSPVKTDLSAELDPFKPNTKLASSPAETEGVGDIDLANYPKKNTAEKGEKETGIKAENFSNSNSSREEEKGKSSDAAAPLEGEDPVQGSAILDTGNNPVLLASGQDLGFDENMFVSGTQAFGDPAAWDLLEQFGSVGETKETDLRKCSLYVKFDPLVKPTLPKTPEKMPAPTHTAPRRAAGNRTHDLLNFSQQNSSQVNMSVGEESICLFGTPPKVSRRRSALSQRRMNVSSVSQTITEEEPAKPVDLLFSLEGEKADDMFLNDPSKKPETTSSTLVEVEEAAVYTETQWVELQQKLLMQYEGQILARERKLTTQVDMLQAQLDTVTAEKTEMNEKLTSMSSCVEEYEKTLNMLIEAKEKSAVEFKDKIENLTKERDQAMEDAGALENSFAEFHRRYEKLKQTLEGFKKNEDTLKETVKMWQEKVKASEDNLAKMKAKAEDKIKELVGTMERKEADAARVEAELKRTKLQVHSLETSLEQKRKENKELTELCDTLIAQVGATGK